MTLITLKDKLVSRLQSRLLLSCYILLIILLKKKKGNKARTNLVFTRQVRVSFSLILIIKF